MGAANMKLSEKLKKLRIKKNITQNQLAKEIYVSRSTIAKYECGLLIPSTEILEKIASFYNIDVSYLTDEIETESNRKKRILNNIIFIVGIIVCFAFIVIAFIPLLHGFEYSYPIPDGEYYPQVITYNWSIIYATLKYKNPIALITIITCIANIVLYMIWKFGIQNYKTKKIIFITSNILLSLNVILIIASIIFACSYAL